MNTGQDRIWDSDESRKRFRHSLRTALDFMNASVQNLSGKHPSQIEALRIYTIGSEKLQEVIRDLDHAGSPNRPLPDDATYNGIRETTYTSQNPEVLTWTQFFHQRVSHLRVFEQFLERLPVASQARARVVGVHWHRFSSFMPWFLCQAAAMMSTNEKRHYVIQTAFEELGMRDVREIHPEMFWSAAQLAKVNANDKDRLTSSDSGAQILQSLKESLQSAKSDDEVMGLLLGLEVPAQENIETVFRSLAYDQETEEGLARHKFFRIHREIEAEHVRLTVSNFLRFSVSDAQKAEFIRGFDTGIHFWSEFWRTVACTVEAEVDLMGSPA